MEGKTIVKTLDLGEGITLLKFDDGEVALVKVITPDGISEDLAEFMEEDEKPKAKAKEEPKATEKPKAKEKAKVEEVEEEEEEQGDAYTWEDLKALDFDELEALCAENELKTDPDEFDEASVEDFRKDIAKEIGVEVPAKAKAKVEEPKAKAKVKEEEPEDDYTWADLKAMDYDELSELCDEKSLDVDPNDYDAEDEIKLRKAIAEELNIDIPKPTRK